MTNPSFKERLNNRVSKDGKLILTPIEFSIKSTLLKKIINEKKIDLKNTIKDLKGKELMYEKYFSASKTTQIKMVEHQLHSLLKLNHIGLNESISKYNKSLLNGKLNVKNIKTFELYPLSISGFVFGKDTLKII